MDDKNRNDEDIQPLSPEEIKAIGEIEIGPSKHEQFLNQHYKKLMWGGIAVSLIAGGTIAWFSHRNDHQVEAAAKVVQALQVKAPNSVVSADQYDAAALAELREAYADTPAAATAALLDGLAALNGADPAAGIAKLQAVVASESNLLIVSRAHAAMAAWYMSDGKPAESAAAWQKIVDMGETPYTALAYLTLGDLAKADGKTDNARNYYEQAKVKCATSPLVTGKTIEMRLMLLDVDAPRPVAPAPKATDTPTGSAPSALDPFGTPAPAPAAPATPEADPFNLTTPGI